MRVTCLIPLTFFAHANAKSFQFDSSSKAGERLLSKSRRLGNDDGYDYTWMTGYSIQFDSCHTYHQFDDAGRDQEDGQGSPFRPQLMTKFKLCSTSECSSSSSCKGPEYITRMQDFFESYEQAKETEKEYLCEKIEENCACDDDNVDDEACLSNCYDESGIDCGQNDDGNNDQDNNIQELIECRQINEGNDDGNQKQAYYVGGYCGDGGKSAYLSVFSDSSCEEKADSQIFYNLNGYALPYTSSSMVDSSCVGCGLDNGNDDAYNMEVSESCTEMYERAGKCEDGFSDVIDYPNYGACEFMNDILPALEKLESHNYRVGGGASVAWAWVFGLCTIGLVGYVYMLTDGKFVKEDKVALSSSGGGLA